MVPVDVSVDSTVPSVTGDAGCVKVVSAAEFLSEVAEVVTGRSFSLSGVFLNAKNSTVPAISKKTAASIIIIDFFELLRSGSNNADTSNDIRKSILIEY